MNAVAIHPIPLAHESGTAPRNHSLSPPKYLPWIEIAKGLGISTVVLGHMLNVSAPLHRFIYVFHMPLFFFLSGYLHTPQSDYAFYFKKKARHLLIPYAAFLIVLFGLECVRIFHRDGTGHAIPQAALAFLWGGDKLRGDYAVFWFISCLFLTQQLANALLTTITQKWLISTAVAGLALAYIKSLLFPSFQLPMSADVVPVALFFYISGYFSKHLTFHSRWLYAFAFVGTAVAGLFVWRGLPVDFNMRGEVYGIPILSPLLGIACISSVLYLSRMLVALPNLAMFLTPLGAASMGIMFLHLPVGLNLHFIKYVGRNPYLTSLLTLAICYLVTRLLARFSFISLVFLGRTAHR